jgi:hypothetical protein
MTKRGCPIADIAPSRRLNAMVEAFLQAESFELSPGAWRFQEQLYRDSGLQNETAETLLALKNVLAKHRARDTKKNRS